MERVTLLVEETGAQISSLLNPASLAFQRRAGVRTRAALGTAISGAPPGEAALIYTGEAITELTLDLLFDTDFLPGARPPEGGRTTTVDIRAETAALWRLSEATEARAPAAPDLPRFLLIWGQATKLRCVVLALSERLERFDASGVPQRAWMRLRLRVLQEADADPRGYLPLPDPIALPVAEDPRLGQLANALTGGSAEAPAGEPFDGSAEAGVQSLTLLGGERLESIAARFLGSPALWRWLAVLNGLFDPFRLEPGTVLIIRPPPGWSGPAGEERAP